MYSSTLTNPRSTWIFVFSMPTLSVRGARPTATSTFSASIFCCFAIDSERHRNAGLCLLDLLDFGVDEAIDAALAIHARQLLRNFFVFDGNIARQHLQDRHVRAKRLVDAGELHAHRARTDHDQRLGNVVQAQHFDVGQDLRVGLQPRQHARHRSRRQE